METNYMFNDISVEELYDIDGGSTKVVATVAVIAGIFCAIGSYVASETGHPEAALALGGAAATCGLVAAWCAVIPFI